MGKMNKMITMIMMMMMRAIPILMALLPSSCHAFITPSSKTTILSRRSSRSATRSVTTVSLTSSNPRYSRTKKVDQEVKTIQAQLVKELQTLEAERKQIEADLKGIELQRRTINGKALVGKNRLEGLQKKGGSSGTTLNAIDAAKKFVVDNNLNRKMSKDAVSAASVSASPSNNAVSFNLFNQGRQSSSTKFDTEIARLENELIDLKTQRKSTEELASATTRTFAQIGGVATIVATLGVAANILTANSGTTNQQQLLPSSGNYLSDRLSSLLSSSKIAATTTTTIEDSTGAPIVIPYLDKKIEVLEKLALKEEQDIQQLQKLVSEAAAENDALRLQLIEKETATTKVMKVENEAFRAQLLEKNEQLRLKFEKETQAAQLAAEKKEELRMKFIKETQAAVDKKEAMRLKVEQEMKDKEEKLREEATVQKQKQAAVATAAAAKEQQQKEEAAAATAAAMVEQQQQDAIRTIEASIPPPPPAGTVFSTANKMTSPSSKTLFSAPLPVINPFESLIQHIQQEGWEKVTFQSLDTLSQATVITGSVLTGGLIAAADHFAKQRENDTNNNNTTSTSTVTFGTSPSAPNTRIRATTRIPPASSSSSSSDPPNKSPGFGGSSTSPSSSSQSNQGSSSVMSSMMNTSRGPGPRVRGAAVAPPPPKKASSGNGGVGIPPPKKESSQRPFSPFGSKFGSSPPPPQNTGQQPPTSFGIPPKKGVSAGAGVGASANTGGGVSPPKKTTGFVGGNTGPSFGGATPKVAPPSQSRPNNNKNSYPSPFGAAPRSGTGVGAARGSPPSKTTTTTTTKQGGVSPFGSSSGFGAAAPKTNTGDAGAGRGTSPPTKTAPKQGGFSPFGSSSGVGGAAPKTGGGAGVARGSPPPKTTTTKQGGVSPFGSSSGFGGAAPKTGTMGLPSKNAVPGKQAFSPFGTKFGSGASPKQTTTSPAGSTGLGVPPNTQGVSVGQGSTTKNAAPAKFGFSPKKQGAALLPKKKAAAKGKQASSPFGSAGLDGGVASTNDDGSMNNTGGSAPVSQNRVRGKEITNDRPSQHNSIRNKGGAQQGFGSVPKKQSSLPNKFGVTSAGLGGGTPSPKTSNVVVPGQKQASSNPFGAPPKSSSAGFGSSLKSSGGAQQGFGVPPTKQSSLPNKFGVTSAGLGGGAPPNTSNVVVPGQKQSSSNPFGAPPKSSSVGKQSSPPPNKENPFGVSSAGFGSFPKKNPVGGVNSSSGGAGFGGSPTNGSMPPPKKFGISNNSPSPPPKKFGISNKSSSLPAAPPNNNFGVSSAGFGNGPSKNHPTTTTNLGGGAGGGENKNSPFGTTTTTTNGSSGLYTSDPSPPTFGVRSDNNDSSSEFSDNEDDNYNNSNNNNNNGSPAGTTSFSFGSPSTSSSFPSSPTPPFPPQSPPSSSSSTE